MGSPWFRWILLAAAAAPAAGCLEGDSSIELNEKGGGTVALSARFSIRFQAYGRQLARLDPSYDPVKGAEPLFLKVPDEAAAKDLDRAGLKVLSQETSRTDTDLSTRFRVQFRQFSSLEALGRIRGGDPAGTVPPESGRDFPGDAIRLSRDQEGVYTLEQVLPVRASMSFATEKVAADTGKFGKFMEISQPFTDELSRYRVRAALQVPGEIVDFSPAGCGKADPAKDPATKKSLPARVVFDFDRAALDATGLKDKDLKGEYLFPVLRVRFRLPKGKSIPDAALWAGKPAAAPLK